MDSLTDRQLLDLRLCDLPLKIKGSQLEHRVAKLYNELEARWLAFKPHIWLSEEWFTPDGVSGFAIPFYLAHPRLIRLERKQMLEVEGASEAECMKILRHEAGHAIDNAYRLHARRSWADTFGSYRVPYPEWYQPQPGSRDYVLNLDAWYAQAHPAEDFAETFAVWLKPGARWRRQYEDWGANRKLAYVNHIMTGLIGRAPARTAKLEVEPLASLTKTLREHYRRKRAYYTIHWPASYERNLYRVFSASSRRQSAPSAAQFLRHYPRRDQRHRRARNWRPPLHGQSHCQTHDRALQGTEPAPQYAGRRSSRVHRRCTDNAGNAGFTNWLSPDSTVTFEPTTKLRIVVLLSQELMPPETIPDGVEKEKQRWRTEYDVISTLKSMGHDVYPVGLASDLAVIAKAIEEHKPHIAFNLLEDFEGHALFDQHVVSYLELLKQPYTGCNPRGLTIAHDKALTKKILSYHRISVPDFAVFPIGQKVQRRRVEFPLFVKSVVEEGSVGISQASVVTDYRETRRTRRIHSSANKSHAIAEQYIEGREIYMSVIGNRRFANVHAMGTGH